MKHQLFARANPSNLTINELYQYYANISGNPTIDEKGQPQGIISLQVPYDGYEYFTRDAYADVKLHHQASSNELCAAIGHLAVSGISSDDFWSEHDTKPPRQVLKLEVPVPGDTEDLGMLKDDRRVGLFSHHYQPAWPEVYPRPRPVMVTVEVYDERTLSESILEGSTLDELTQITHELSFERSLIFDFKVEIALPKKIKLDELPVIRRMSLEWPVATSYRMLHLNVGAESSIDKEGQEHPIYYVPEEGSVEWRDIQFESGLLDPDSDESITTHVDAPHFYSAPMMRLKVDEPGELYQKPILVSRLEIELPNVLLSGLQSEYFAATGYPAQVKSIAKKTTLLVDMEINLEQRFDRKVFSPYQHLQFEGVMLEDIRMMDVTTLLRDLGFHVIPFDSKPYLTIEESGSQRKYAVVGRKTEGPDEMNIVILAKGTLGKTERETIIPGGKTFKTVVDSGNLELEMRAELRGNVQKLTNILNTIHTSLKERFSHVTTLE